MKLSRSDGAERWRYTFGGTPFAFADLVAFDRHGDVVAAGGLQKAPLTAFSFLVAKLRGRTGAERWHHVTSAAGGPLLPVFGRPAALAVDGYRDVVVAGGLRGAGTDIDFTVLKLGRTHGEELWRRSIDGGASAVDFALGLGIDRQRDVLAVGSTQAKSPAALLGSAFLVLKLGRSDGHVVWQGDVGAGAASTVALDPTGDVISGGITPQDPSSDTVDFTVVKLRGSDGH